MCLPFVAFTGSFCQETGSYIERGLGESAHVPAKFGLSSVPAPLPAEESKGADILVRWQHHAQYRMLRDCRATSRVEGRNCRTGAVEPVDMAREGMLDLE
jgi:hypothetical protein